MEILYTYSIQQWAAHFLVDCFLVGGVLVFAAGAGFVAWNEGIQRISANLNRWVSTRQPMRPLEISRDSAQFVHRHRRWFAAFFVVGACYSIFGLGTAFNEYAFIYLFNMQTWPVYVSQSLVEGVRLVLLLGNAVAIAIGIMLISFPEKLVALETKGGRWFSVRQGMKGGQTRNDWLEKLVAAHPRAAGLVFALVGLAMTGGFAAIRSELL